MSVAIRRALYGRMAGDTTLTAMLASPPTGFNKAIFYQYAPSGAREPYIIFSKQAGTPTYAMSAKLMDHEVWQIKGVGTDMDVADAISTRLNALLTDGSLSISGATKLYLRRMSDVDYAEVEDGVQYHNSGSLYRLIYA